MLASKMRRVPLIPTKPITTRPIYTSNHHGKILTFNTPSALTPPPKLIPSLNPATTILRPFSTTPPLSAKIIQRSPLFLYFKIIRLMYLGVGQTYGACRLWPREFLKHAEHTHIVSYLGGLTYEWLDKAEMNFQNAELVHEQMKEPNAALARMLKLFELPSTTAIHKKGTRVREEVGTVSTLEFWSGLWSDIFDVESVTVEQEMEIVRRLMGLWKGFEENFKRMKYLCEKYRDESAALHKKFVEDLDDDELVGLPIAEVREGWMGFYNEFNLECEKLLKDPTLLDDPLNSLHTYLLKTFRPQGYSIDIKIPRGRAKTKDALINSNKRLDTRTRKEVTKQCDFAIKKMTEIDINSQIEKMRRHRRKYYPLEGDSERVD